MANVHYEHMLPAFNLPASDGQHYHRRSWHGRRDLVLVLLHGSDCPACREVLAKLRADVPELDILETTIVPVVADTPAAVRELARDLELPFAVLADVEGTLRRQLVEEGEAVALLVTDKFGSVMTREAGHERDLPTGTALLRAAEFVAFQCPECYDFVPWGE